MPIIRAAEAKDLKGVGPKILKDIARILEKQGQAPAPHPTPDALNHVILPSSSPPPGLNISNFALIYYLAISFS